MMWAEKAWPEIPGVLQAVNGAAILPVGATEQHGPQLGCGMDFVLADKLCRKVSEVTGMPMLPTMPYGCSIGHSKRWPGTIALDPAVMTMLVTQIGTWAYHSGVRRLFISGITRPYCVDWTAEDSAASGFETWVVEDACSRLGPDDALDASRARLEAQGVRFTNADQLCD